ncbi:hypothetical protein HZS_7351 [Henneguya salminicola]|nr:hypothetical protein HZS_7351 [Henneguya salminicola]
MIRAKEVTRKLIRFNSDIFVQYAYSLMTRLLECLNLVLLHEIIFLSQFASMVKYISTDFEKILIDAIKYEFL